MNNTSVEYDEIISGCRKIFVKKLKDYGTAWRILRSASLTDQLYIKAQRIRNIQLKGEQRVEDNIQSEFMGIVNYCVIGLIQLEKGSSEEKMENNNALALYDHYLQQSKALMEDKNYDYGEAWRQMRISSLTDMILMKLQRTRQIEDNEGLTLISEGIDANYYDMINYAVFALIKLQNKNNR